MWSPDIELLKKCLTVLKEVVGVLPDEDNTDIWIAYKHSQELIKEIEDRLKALEICR